MLSALTTRLSVAPGLMPLIFFYLLSPLSSLGTVCSWKLAASRGSLPVCFAMSSVLWLDKQREQHTWSRAWQVSGRDSRLGSPVGQVCFSCVHTGQLGLVELLARALQSSLDSVVRVAVPSSHGHQAPPTSCNINTRASVDPTLARAPCCAQGAALSL